MNSQYNEAKESGLVDGFCLLVFFFNKEKNCEGRGEGKNRVKAGMMLEGDFGKGLLSQTCCDSETEWSQTPAPDCRADRHQGNQDELLHWEMLTRQSRAEGFPVGKMLLSLSF